MVNHRNAIFIISEVKGDRKKPKKTLRKKKSLSTTCTKNSERITLGSTTLRDCAFAHAAPALLNSQPLPMRSYGCLATFQKQTQKISLKESIQ